MIYEIIALSVILIASQLIPFLFKNKSFNIYASAFLYWIVGYIIIDKIAGIDSISQTIEVILATNLFLIFLKPLATYITGIIKNRKIWIYASTAIMFLLIIFTCFVDLNVSYFLKIFIFILVAFCLSNQSLFYLILNEQVYNTKQPIRSSFLIATFINGALVISFILYKYSPQSNSEDFIVNILLVIFLLSSTLSLLLVRESKENFITLDNSLLSEQEKYKTRTIYIIILVGMFVGFVYAFYSSTYYSLINSIDLYIVIFLTLPLLFSYLLYKFFLSKYDHYYIAIVLLAIVAINAIINLFFSNKYFIYYVLISNGFCLYTFYYMLFGMAIMWNYRVSRRPITGFCAGAFVLGGYLFSLVRNFSQESDGLYYFDFNFIVYSLLVVISLLAISVLLTYFKRDIFAEHTKHIKVQVSNK